MKIKGVVAAILAAVLCINSTVFAAFMTCPSADLTGDCRVDLADFAVLALPEQIHVKTVEISHEKYKVSYL